MSVGERAARVGFPETRWSLIEALKGSDTAARARAMSDLFRIYGPAVETYLRWLGAGVELAGELAQAFFATKVIENGLFERAERARCTHLRSFVRTAVRRFWIDQCARKGGSEGAMGREPACGEDPGAAFDRRWACLAVAEAVRRCRSHYEAIGKARNWLAFERRVLAPAVRDARAPSPGELAVELGFASARDASAAIQTVKRAFEDRLRGVVGETSEDVEEELAALRAMLDA